MWHHNLQLIIISFQGLISVTFVQSQEQCTNPIGQTGNCIRITECEPLVQLLRRYRTSVAVKDFVKNSACDDNQDLNPKVCCVYGDGRVDRNGNPSPPNQTISTTLQSTTYWPIHAPICGVPKVQLTRIVGGSPAKLGSWPWLAALGYRSKKSTKPIFICGGSLISSRHVMTAAHCLNRDLYLVRLGDLDLNDDVQDGASPIDIPIEQMHKHPSFSDFHLTNDIAVLRLKWDVQFTDVIRPLCLPLTDDIAKKDFTGSLPFAAGWGAIYFNGPSSTHLQQVQLPVVSTETCRAAFTRVKETVIDHRVICAGFTMGGRDTCQGDSGAPLMSSKNKVFYAIGIVSYSDRCAEPGIPAVYTRVTEFLDFVKSHLK